VKQQETLLKETKETFTRESGKGGCEEKVLEATSLSSYMRIKVE